MSGDVRPVVPYDLEDADACGPWAVNWERRFGDLVFSVRTRCIHYQGPDPDIQGPFKTHAEALAMVARLNADGLRRTIEICQAALRQQNARLVKAYHAQGMTVAEAIHRFIEERKSK